MPTWSDRAEPVQGQRQTQLHNQQGQWEGGPGLAGRQADGRQPSSALWGVAHPAH